MLEVQAYKERVYAALVRLTGAYQERRKEIPIPPELVRIPAPRPVFAPKTPPIVVCDHDLHAELPDLSLLEINVACVKLISEGRIKVVNADFVRVAQDGHSFEVLVPREIVPETLEIKAVKKAVLELWNRRPRVPFKLMDIEVMRILDRHGVNLPLYQVNTVLYSFCSRHILQQETEVMNVHLEGQTYELVGELREFYESEV